MARTKKDRPYAVRAKEATKGTVKHHRYCNGIARKWGDFTKTETHIFHANEVKEMNAVKEAATEAGSAVKITEKSGYLVSYDPNLFLDKFYGRTVKPIVREKVIAELTGPRGDKFYSAFDVFYIFEVTTVVRSAGEEDACCGAVLPKSLTSKSGCPCCRYPEQRETRNRVRDELVGIRKEHYVR